MGWKGCDERKTRYLCGMEQAKEYNKAFGGINFRPPFTDGLNNTSIPIGMKAPRFNPYDSTRYPYDHVSNF